MRPSDLNPGPATGYVLDRPAEIWAIRAELSGDISSPGPVVVTGIDGMGRSTLLEQAAMTGVEHGWVALRARCQDQPESADEVATWLCDQIGDADNQIESMRARLRDRVRNFFRRSMKLSVTASVAGMELAPEISWGKAVEEGHQDPWLRVQQRLRVVGRHAALKHRGLLLVIDNLDALVAAPQGPAYADFIVDAIYQARMAGVPVAGFLSMRTATLSSIEQRYPDFGTKVSHFEVTPLRSDELARMLDDWQVAGAISPETLLQRTSGHTTLVKAWLTALRAGLKSGDITLPVPELTWGSLQSEVIQSVGADTYDWMLRAARDSQRPDQHLHPPTVAYHVAPVASRDTILAHGIDYRLRSAASRTLAPSARHIVSPSITWSTPGIAKSERGRTGLAAAGYDAKLFSEMQFSDRTPEQVAGLPYLQGEALPRPVGNYLYSTLEDAERFLEQHGKQGREIWAVRTTGLDLKPDPEPAGESWYAEAAIPATELIERIRPGIDVSRQRAGTLPLHHRRPLLPDVHQPIELSR